MNFYVIQSIQEKMYLDMIVDLEPHTFEQSIVFVAFYEISLYEIKNNKAEQKILPGSYFIYRAILTATPT
jgi:hypothetical protein